MKIIQLSTPVAILVSLAAGITLALGLNSMFKDAKLSTSPLGQATAWVKAKWLDLRIALTPVESY